MPCRLLSYAPEHKAKARLRPSRQAIRRAALAFAAALGVAAAADFRPLLPHHRPLPRNDRRRLCQSQFHDHRAEGLRLHRRGPGYRQRAGESRPVAGTDRRPRFQSRAEPGQGRRRGGRSRGKEPRRADRIAGAADPTAGGRGRCGRSHSEIRAARSRPATTA